MHRLAIHIFVLALSFMVSGCLIISDRTMDAGLDLSEYNAGTSEAVFWQNGWWEQYDDAQLNGLIEQAFKDNPSLNQMRARLEQAKAGVRVNRSAFFPSTEIGVERTKFQGDQSQNFGSTSDFSLRGAASYELDVWGRTRANVKSARLQRDAREEDLYAGGITLAANIVNNWLEVVSLREQETIIRKQIETNQTVLALQEKRFERGSAGALDVLQQEENLARSEALLPDILSAQRRAVNNLAVLVGTTPSDAPVIAVRPLPPLLDLPPSGLPSDLLIDRPDLRAAWATLISQDWATRAAFADRLPRFDLSAVLTGNSAKIAELLDDWLLNLAAGVTAPLNTTGRGQAVQRRQAAIAQEAFYAYKEAVLQAVLDVENSLTQNAVQDQKLTSLERQLNASYKTLEQAQFSYANGESSYINVLTSLTNVQGLELQIAQERLVQAQGRVSLHRALGGRSWAEKIIEQDLEDE